MKLVKIAEKYLICNEGSGDAGVPRCAGKLFRVRVLPSGMRTLECQECGYHHEIEQAMPGFVEGE